MYIIKLLCNFSCLQVRLLLRSKFQFVFLPMVVVVGRYSCRKRRKPSLHDSEGTSTECCRYVEGIRSEDETW